MTSGFLKISLKSLISGWACDKLRGTARPLISYMITGVLVRSPLLSIIA